MLGLLITVLSLLLALGPLFFLFFLLPLGPSCPQCGEEALLLHAPLLRPLRRLVSLRWCLRCGWEGLTRRRVWRRPFPTLETAPKGAEQPNHNRAWRRQREGSGE